MPVASLPRGGGRSELGWVEQAMVGPSRQKKTKETKVLTNRGGSRILEGGGAWGVGDRIAVRSSQVCAPGGSEGMPPRSF